MGVPLLAQVLAVANRAAARLVGGRILYKRGDEKLAFEATFGLALEMADDTGMGGTVRVEYSDRDFIFPAAKLIFGGRRFEPKDGDRITVVEQNYNDGEVYEVMPIPGANSWRSCDPQGFMIRVHTKKVKTAS